MKAIIAILGASLAILLCGGMARAGVAEADSPPSRAALLGRQGFAEEFIKAGAVRETAPVLLAKRRKKSKGRKDFGRGSESSGGMLQIDPNTAELEKLMMLPLVDREEAESIIEYRKTNRIDTPEEMLEIKGIKPLEYRIFKHLIVIRETSVEMGAATAAPQVLRGGAETGETKAATEASRVR